MRIFQALTFASFCVAKPKGKAPKALTEGMMLDKQECEEWPEDFVAGRRRIIREGENSILARVLHDYDENLDASVVVVFSQKYCGPDFINKLQSGKSEEWYVFYVRLKI